MGRVLGLDLALEAVHLVHRLALVVAARHEEVLRVEQLEAEQREDALDRERAPVHKVPVEQLRVPTEIAQVYLQN